jgi:hypothetical protein
MQPALVIGNDCGSANHPYARFGFFDKNLPSCIFLSKRNLSTRADDLDAYLHMNFLENVTGRRGVSQLMTCNHGFMLHDSMIS